MSSHKASMVLPVVALAGIALTLAGCFKSPTDPNLGTGGGGNVPNVSSDHTTTAISALASQANSNGIYLSVANQNGDPISASNLTGANFQITYNGTNVPSGSLTLSTASGAGQAISSALVLDYSGSMSSTNITDMETGATAFVNNMQSADRGEIIKFSDYPVIEQAYTSDKNALRTAITRPTGISGGVTAFWDGTYMGITTTANETGQRAVVAFTDGYENNSTEITSQADLITRARNRGVPVFTVGLGSADTTGLQEIANQTGGRYYYAPTSAELAQIYQQIAQIFNNTIIITWPSFTYVSGATVNITVTYVCANGTFTSSTSIVLP